MLTCALAFTMCSLKLTFGAKTFGKDRFLTSTTPTPRRYKRTVVPTGILPTCPEGHRYIASLSKCHPISTKYQLPGRMRGRPSRPTAKVVPSVTTETMTTSIHPSPEPLYSTIGPAKLISTSESNSIFNGIDDINEEAENHLKLEKVVARKSTISDLEKDAKYLMPTTFKPLESAQSEALQPIASRYIDITETPIPQVDLRFIQLRELRLVASSNHRNCRYHYDVRQVPSNGDDDYD